MNAPGPLALIVEDDVQLLKFLRASLRAHAYRVLEARNAEEALKAANEYAPDVLLLDLGLPDADGSSVIQRVREWSRVPIIVISARTQETQKVAALDAGADDYLTKPFGVEELLARMRAALRRSTPVSNVFCCGPLSVDLEGRHVEVDGREVRLTAIEFKLLAALIAHAGNVVTHRQLLELVWGPNNTEETQYLRVYMAHLRRKLEPDPLRPRLFGTEVGVGYRLLV